MKAVGEFGEFEYCDLEKCHRTMLDALIPAVTELRHLYKDHKDVGNKKVLKRVWKLWMFKHERYGLEFKFGKRMVIWIRIYSRNM